MLTFKIEQLAISPKDPAKARKLLEDMGLTDWVEDEVKAHGVVRTQAAENTAQLSFNYQAFAGNELEILDYKDGINWIESGTPWARRSIVSHVGMHVTAEELSHWRAFFVQRGISVAQEVVTNSHTNPAIKDTRRYNYVIFDTKEILGVDVKFIVRLAHNG